MTRLFPLPLLLLLPLTACDGIGSALGLNWSRAPHPCEANRTDALHVDSDGTLWVGCGTGTRGEGLYRSTNGGSSWAVPDSPGDTLSAMRVNDVWRAGDGTLYVSGTAPDGVRIVMDSGDGWQSFWTVPEDRPQSWQTFQVDTFRIDGQGRAIAESLTGSDVLYWPAGAQEPTNGHGWWEGLIDGGAQILDLELHGGQFYGSGSTIDQPPYVYLEPDGGMNGQLAFDAIDLGGTDLGAIRGEAWDIGIGPGGAAVVAGVDQGPDLAVAWVADGSLGDPNSWITVDFGSAIPDPSTQATRLYGACRDEDLVVVVGDYSQLAEALVLVSEDGGRSWRESPPPGTDTAPAGPMTRCRIQDDVVHVVGADGFYGTWTP